MMYFTVEQVQGLGEFSVAVGLCLAKCLQLFAFIFEQMADRHSDEISMPDIGAGSTKSLVSKHTKKKFSIGEFFILQLSIICDEGVMVNFRVERRGNPPSCAAIFQSFNLFNMVHHDPHFFLCASHEILDLFFSDLCWKVTITLAVIIIACFMIYRAVEDENKSSTKVNLSSSLSGQRVDTNGESEGESEEESEPECTNGSIKNSQATFSFQPHGSSKVRFFFVFQLHLLSIAL